MKCSLNILLTIDRPNDNDYAEYLAKGLESMANIMCSIDAFWEPRKDINILHIQWPEYFFKANNYEIKDFVLCLNKWIGYGAKIVTTRHNYLPHFNKSGSMSDIYNITYKYSNAIIHLGNHSLNEFKEKYKDKVQVVIPHHDYKTLPSSITREEARKRLSISDDEKIFLVFGNIRTQKEIKLIRKAFKHYPYKNKALLCTSYFPEINVAWKKKPFKRAILNIKNLLFKVLNKTYLSNQNVPRGDIQIYLKAADTLFISRFNQLNSGLLFLGLTFGVRIIAPRCGNLTEYIDEYGINSYIASDISSLKEAVKRDVSNCCKTNTYNFSYNKAANMHIDLYMKLISK